MRHPDRLDHADVSYSRDMRIVVSGTHASGKSTLVSDFALRHREFTVLPDPFDLVDETSDRPSVALFAAQLRVSADRLDPEESDENLIAERGPIDFIAYLLALDDLSGTAGSRELMQRSMAISREALDHVDCSSSCRLPRSTESRQAPTSIWRFGTR